MLESTVTAAAFIAAANKISHDLAALHGCPDFKAIKRYMRQYASRDFATGHSGTMAFEVLSAFHSMSLEDKKTASIEALTVYRDAAKQAAEDLDAYQVKAAELLVRALNTPEHRSPSMIDRLCHEVQHHEALRPRFAEVVLQFDELLFAMNSPEEVAKMYAEQAEG